MTRINVLTCVTLACIAHFQIVELEQNILCTKTLTRALLTLVPLSLSLHVFYCCALAHRRNHGADAVGMCIRWHWRPSWMCLDCDEAAASVK